MDLVQETGAPQHPRGAVGESRAFSIVHEEAQHIGLTKPAARGRQACQGHGASAATQAATQAALYGACFFQRRTVQTGAVQLDNAVDE